MSVVGNSARLLSRPSVNDGSQVDVDFLLRKQARNELLLRRDRICPLCVHKCLPWQHFLNEAEGARTLNLRIDSPMLYPIELRPRFLQKSYYSGRPAVVSMAFDTICGKF